MVLTMQFDVGLRVFVSSSGSEMTAEYISPISVSSLMRSSAACWSMTTKRSAFATGSGSLQAMNFRSTWAMTTSFFRSAFAIFSSTSSVFRSLNIREALAPNERPGLVSPNGVRALVGRSKRLNTGFSHFYDVVIGQHRESRCIQEHCRTFSASSAHNELAGVVRLLIVLPLSTRRSICPFGSAGVVSGSVPGS